MFAHAIGMGLFDNEKINWLSDAHWDASGYKLIRKYDREVNHWMREINFGGFYVTEGNEYKSTKPFWLFGICSWQ